jgi:uridine kinase
MRQFTEQTINQYVKRVKPSYEQYIEPTRSFADIIVYTNVDYTRLKTFKLIKEDVIENLNL